jgi:hypothetical protein
MKQFIIIFIFAMFSISYAESASNKPLVKQYFEAWVASQQPDASIKDLEHYLSFLSEDVAWQHLPYAKSDERKAGGKETLKQGMLNWLGNHHSYSAELIRVENNQHFMIIEFRSVAQAIDSSGEKAMIRRHYLDVLELDENRVAIVRRYDLQAEEQ